MFLTPKSPDFFLIAHGEILCFGWEAFSGLKIVVDFVKTCSIEEISEVLKKKSWWRNLYLPNLMSQNALFLGLKKAKIQFLGVISAKKKREKHSKMKKNESFHRGGIELSKKSY